MKIAVATTKGGLEDLVSPIFGRCQTYTIVEIDDKKIKDAGIIQNQYVSAGSGAGIQAAQLVISQGVKTVIAGNFGPNASMIFDQSGVEMVRTQGISVKETVTKYLNKELASTPTPTQPIGAPQPGISPGYSPGTGRGMGRGGGMGRGRGGGGGRGMGMGRGMGAGGSDVCTCPNCRYTAPHVRGTPCFAIKCPQCGTPMRGTWCY